MTVYLLQIYMEVDIVFHMNLSAISLSISSCLKSLLTLYSYAVFSRTQFLYILYSPR
jgi:hypothetical protein